MRIEGKEYRTIWFENNSVKIIDQTKLPHKFIVKELKTVNDAINAIKTMEVTIWFENNTVKIIDQTKLHFIIDLKTVKATSSIWCSYGLVLAILENNDQSFFKKSSEDLINSRPTAINLKWAVDRMMKNYQA